MSDFIFFILLYQISTINVYIYNSEIMKKLKKMILGSADTPKADAELLQTPSQLPTPQIGFGDFGLVPFMAGSWESAVPGDNPVSNGR